MMRQSGSGGWHATGSTVFFGLQWGFGAVVAIAGGASKMLPGVPSDLPLVESTLKWAAANAWWIVLVFTVLAFLAKEASSWCKSQWIWAVVQTIVDEIQRVAFPNIGSDPLHYHRVTLFKRHRMNWRLWQPKRGPMWWPWGSKCGPFSGWLYPMRRSGHTSKNSDVVFLAPDDADRAEGVAGRIWSQAKPLTLHVDKRNCGTGADWDEPTKRNYEKATFLPAGWLNHRKGECDKLAQSFWGIPVEVKGQRWGVLLIDSRAPDVKFGEINEKLIVSMLDKLLQRA